MLACLVGMSAEVQAETFTVPYLCSVHDGSVNVFTNRIGKYLVRVGYTYNSICGLVVCCHLRCSLDGNLVKSCKIWGTKLVLALYDISHFRSHRNVPITSSILSSFPALDNAHTSQFKKR